MVSNVIKNRFPAIQWIVLLAALALSCLPAGAQSSQQGGSSQDDSQANQSNGNNQNPQNNNSQDTNTPAPQDVPFSGLNSVAPPQTQIYQIGTASLLSPVGRYHWGPLSLGSSDVRAAVDVIRPTNPLE